MRYLSIFCIGCFYVSLAGAQGIVIDHTCVNLSEIPPLWINAVQNTIQSHYAHTSHGGQLIYGLEFLEEDNDVFSYEIELSNLPESSSTYCIYDGQRFETYVSPELYWETEEGLDMTRAVLDNNPELDTSMWSWCTQCNWYGEEEVQAYLDAMTLLEQEYPEVVFVYFTGNAQARGAEGYNRFMRNNQIREYCFENNKVLFDFADIECWWYDSVVSEWQRSYYIYDVTEVPVEHQQYHSDEFGHTSVENCLNKGIAWWWMMTVIAGRTVVN